MLKCLIEIEKIFINKCNNNTNNKIIIFLLNVIIKK